MNRFTAFQWLALESCFRHTATMRSVSAPKRSKAQIRKDRNALREWLITKDWSKVEEKDKPAVAAVVESVVRLFYPYPDLAVKMKPLNWNQYWISFRNFSDTISVTTLYEKMLAPERDDQWATVVDVLLFPKDRELDVLCAPDESAQVLQREDSPPPSPEIESKHTYVHPKLQISMHDKPSLSDSKPVIRNAVTRDPASRHSKQLRFDAVNLERLHKIESHRDRLLAKQILHAVNNLSSKIVLSHPPDVAVQPGHYVIMIQALHTFRITRLYHKFLSLARSPDYASIIDIVMDPTTTSGCLSFIVARGSTIN